MQEAGGAVVKHYRDLAFMGFVEVLKNLRTILDNIDFCKQDILDYQPDALVLIDYPGFNLRIAKWAKQQGIPVIYYIAPQVWAWHASRVHAIRRDVDKLLVILPFEPAFFEKHAVAVEYVGHPLLDALVISDQQQAHLPVSATPDQGQRIIALLPGSRRQEVRKILPPMLSVTADFPDYQFIIAGATSLPEAFYQPFLVNHPNVQLLRGATYDILRRATAALVKSGTSTLETALFKVPQVVCYAGNPISYQIARRLVSIKYISLVNLIMDQPLVKELIQQELNHANLKAALTDILNPENAALLQTQYAVLRQKLGGGGASDRAASAILEVIG